MTDEALRWHLQHNHWPPYPVELVPVAQQALAMAEDDPESLDCRISLPENVRREGEASVTVGQLLDDLHLLDEAAVRR